MYNLREDFSRQISIHPGKLSSYDDLGVIHKKVGQRADFLADIFWNLLQAIHIYKIAQKR
jgi:hypothetical protein